jgi:hypothetical protein
MLRLTSQSSVTRDSSGMLNNSLKKKAARELKFLRREDLQSVVLMLFRENLRKAGLSLTLLIVARNKQIWNLQRLAVQSMT